MDRPLLLVDIDGVLAPWGVQACPDGYCEYDLFPGDDQPIRSAAVHGDWLREMAVSFDLVWASAWGLQAHSLLGRILGLDEFPFVPMPPAPFPPADKVPAIAAYVGCRMAAWIDDAIGTEAREWAERRPEPTLLIEVDHTIGMTRDHVDRLLAWATALRH